ncbi:MAG: glutathione peroxidase [Parvibaculales bacterium]
MKHMFALLGIFTVLFTTDLNAADGPELSASTAHRFSFTSIDGDPLALAGYAGKTLLVVNTASKCGFTYQYDGLQALWETYRDRGLVVLGVPSNDFLGQEPGTEQEIKTFCAVNFNVDFPMTSKVHVRGKKAHPFYVWARQQSGGPRWNFHKYLINSQGNLVASFSSGTKPQSQKLIAAVEAHLPPAE